MIVLAYIFKIGLAVLYAPLKLFKTDKNKILFLSRQSNVATNDFKLLKRELESRDKDIKIVGIYQRNDKKLSAKFKFLIATLRSLYHLATAKVCVLDAYWPAVSVLHHKESLKIIQMWHAFGKIKKSGYATLGKEFGRSEKLAKVMKMHANYDLIIAGGKAWNKYYCESFNTTEDKLYNVGLPRIDYLLKRQDQIKKKVYAKYPEFKEKPVVLYAPTFRRGKDVDCSELVENFDYDNYYLVIKPHPNQSLIYSEKEGLYSCKEFTSNDILAICEYLITDYSAIALEGAILKKKTYYYLFDFDEYVSKNGVNINLFEEMPNESYKDINDIINRIKSNDYNMAELDKYISKFLPEKLGVSTKKIVDKIQEYRGV
jgi:CDP-ribitol ribitolphosphotransferase